MRGKKNYLYVVIRRDREAKQGSYLWEDTFWTAPVDKITFSPTPVNLKLARRALKQARASHPEETYSLREAIHD